MDWLRNKLETLEKALKYSIPGKSIGGSPAPQEMDPSSQAGGAEKALEEVAEERSAEQ